MPSGLSRALMPLNFQTKPGDSVDLLVQLTAVGQGLLQLKA